MTKLFQYHVIQKLMEQETWHEYVKTDGSLLLQSFEGIAISTSNIFPLKLFPLILFLLKPTVTIYLIFQFQWYRTRQALTNRVHAYVRNILEIIDFTNCRTLSSFNKYAHKHFCSYLTT